jgi:2'-5' RNA ligase
MRCFIAVELPDCSTETFVAMGAAIRVMDDPWTGEKWVAPELMHVTLRFLGDVDEHELETLKVEFAARLGALRPFPLAFDRLSAIPRPGRASLIWVDGVDSTGQCAGLAESAEAAATTIGLSPEPRAFRPHVTLVRARRPRPVSEHTLLTAAEQAGLLEKPPVSVLSATLFSSRLTPAGPHHERLAEFTLGPG